jgi:hypothetical protein
VGEGGWREKGGWRGRKGREVEEGGEGAGRGGRGARACVRACVRACTRRLTCPLLPNVNLQCPAFAINRTNISLGRWRSEKSAHLKI